MLYILATGAVTIAACMKKYGMPVDIDYFKAVKTLSEENIPIEGLSVKFIYNADTIILEKTNSIGVVSIDYPFNIHETYSVLIEDIDGAENQGEFLTKNAELTEQDTTVVRMKKQ